MGEHHSMQLLSRSWEGRISAWLQELNRPRGQFSEKYNVHLEQSDFFYFFFFPRLMTLLNTTKVWICLQTKRKSYELTYDQKYEIVTTIGSISFD